jgi:outer membrane protein
MPTSLRPTGGALLALLALLLAAPALRAQDTLTLEHAVARALEEGYLARAARANRDASRSQHQAFQARLLPQLSLAGTVPAYSRRIIPVLQPDGSTLYRAQNQTSTDLTATLSQRLPVTGGDLFVSSALTRLQVSGTSPIRSWSSQPFTVGLRQDILRPNLLEWDKKEQPLQAEVAERQYRESREEIALETTRRFFDAYAAKVAYDNAAKTAAVNDTLYTLNQGRFEVGRIGENDLLQSELALLRARTALDAAALDYDRALAALRLALNLPPGTPLVIAEPTRIPDVQADTARAVAEALRNRAAVTNTELQRVRARRRVTTAKLNNGTGATLTASYGFNATAGEFGAAYSNLQEARQLALSVEVPLWQWGAGSNSVRQAEADREAVASTTRLQLEETAQEAHFAVLELEQARRNLLLSAKADSVATKRFEVAYNRYLIGRITIDILYIAQSERDAALSQRVAALRNFWLAYYGLRRATLYDFERGQTLY